VFRLLGLLGGLSVVTDLGTGAPVEESLKRAVVAVRLARHVGCTDGEIHDVVYTSLLQHLGCTAYAHENAHVWGDDITTTRLAFLTDFTDPRDFWRTYVSGTAQARDTSRARVLATAVRAGKKMDTEATGATCEVARDAAGQLGLPASVQDNLFHVMTMWNGKGNPRVGGTAVPLATRIMQVASVAVLFALHAGVDAAVAAVRRRSGSYLDPELADAFLDETDTFLTDLGDMDAHQCLLDSEPDPVSYVDDDRLLEVARAFGHLADLKSPWLHGHSEGVAELAAAATACLRLDAHVATVRVAGHLHDLGRVGISSRIWDKPGPLTRTELDQVRLHSYHSERIVSRVPALDGVAALAGRHHERCDASGYHRGLAAAQLSMPARILGAADAYRALVEGRPHREALSSTDAAARLRAEVGAGRLDGDAVAAVLHEAGAATGHRPSAPAGLTKRQVEVLRLVSTGLSNREIARHLVISPRTAEHHVQDVYARIGVTSRAGAALFAMGHGLVDTGG
jgi:HD-GYP domain-containing protein (c-di-GMP phosphodiesterase class II)/DNA-binding CsgD family transcriptional regulator